jgi:thiol-disulfide isomerase/thioredoxin
MRRVAAAAAALLLVATLGAAPEEFELTDLDGHQQRLSERRGKWVMINFWATWCPPCIHEMPELEAFYRTHKNGKATVWGVTFEDTPPELIREFVADLDVTYPIMGLGHDPVTPFGTVKVLPTTFVIDPAGEFVRRFEGPVTAARLEAVMATPTPRRQVTHSAE